MDFLTRKSNCAVCKSEMSAMRLRKCYCCKKCHQEVCGTCSNNRIMLFCSDYHKPKDYTRPQRVCDLCYKDYILCHEYASNHALKWNTTSTLYTKWIGKVKIPIPNIPKFIPDIETIKKDVDNGRTDPIVFNFSLREFVSYCQRGIPLQQIRQSIMNVLSLMVAHNPIVGYCQGMNFIAAFLLCIADEKGAFQLMAHLFDSIIPPRFYQGNGGAALIGFQAEQHFLLQMVKSKFSEQYRDRLINFVEIQSPQFMLTLLIQNLNASSVLVVWSEMYKRDSFSVIEKAMLHVLECTKDLPLDKPGIVEVISRIVSFEELKQYLIRDDIFGEFERKIMIEQYFAEMSRKWVNDDKLILFRLRKITQFEPDEIREIQKEFKKYSLDAQQCVSQYQQECDDPDTGHYTGSSDEEDNIKSQKQQLRQTKLFKYGIDRTTFQKLMYTFHESYQRYTPLSEEQYQAIFTLFDENNTSLLDFREFLVCLSVMLRGTYQQKLRMYFQAHDKQEISYQEFRGILNLILDKSVIESPEYIQFLMRIEQPSLTFIDMLHVSEDEFLHQERRQERRNTSVTLVQCIQQFNQQFTSD